MHDSERLLIERECQRLVTRYCHYVDHGDAAKIAELFSEDGVWTGPGVRMQGREQLAQGFGLREGQYEADVLPRVQQPARRCRRRTPRRRDGLPEGWRFEDRQIVVSFIREGTTP